jgi:hypothetical protein
MARAMPHMLLIGVAGRHAGVLGRGHVTMGMVLASCR